MVNSMPTIGRTITMSATCLIVGLLAVAACAWISSAISRSLPVGLDGPVYSVAQVRNELGRAPAQWAGRTVQIRGILQSSPTWPCAFTGGTCAAAETQLTDAETPGAAGLTVAITPAEPLVRWLRRLPLLGPLFPSQTPRWGTVATYRVAMRRGAGSGTTIALTVPDTTLPGQ